MEYIANMIGSLVYAPDTITMENLSDESSHDEDLALDLFSEQSYGKGSIIQPAVRGISEIDEEYLFGKLSEPITNDHDTSSEFANLFTVCADQDCDIFSIPITNDESNEIVFQVDDTLFESTDHAVTTEFIPEFLFADDLFEPIGSALTTSELPAVNKKVKVPKTPKTPKKAKTPKVSGTTSTNSHQTINTRKIHICPSAKDCYERFKATVQTRCTSSNTFEQSVVALDCSLKPACGGNADQLSLEQTFLKETFSTLTAGWARIAAQHDAYMQAFTDIAGQSEGDDHAESDGLFGPMTGLREIHHYFHCAPEGAAEHTAKSIKTLMKELNLCLSEAISVDSRGGSMFVRYDEDNPQYIRAIISGSEGSPYENGLFMFDIYVPGDYPTVPCMVTHVTPGANTIRAPNGPGGFSPNMHSDSGKVCLSLLGTWSGLGWEPGVSNLYQVLSSISLMILAAEYAYYMEPGYGGWEDTANIDTDPGRIDVLQYNDAIRAALLRWCMIEPMLKPSKGFERVVKLHFVKRWQKITATVEMWLQDFCSCETCPRHADPSKNQNFRELQRNAIDLASAYRTLLSTQEITDEVQHDAVLVKSVRYLLASVECEIDQEDGNAMGSESEKSKELQESKQAGAKLLSVATGILARHRAMISTIPLPTLSEAAESCAEET